MTNAFCYCLRTMPADIRKLLSKSQPPSTPRQPTTVALPTPPPDPNPIITRPTPPVVNLDPEPAAPTSPATDAAPQCSLPCCDTSTSVAARLVVDKERTAQGEGKRKRYFNPDWLDQFKWLVLCKTYTKGFCQICRYAIRNKLPTFSKNGEPAFTTSGFTNWKKGKERFTSHQKSEFHRECLMKTTQLKNATPINAQVTDNLKVQF